MEVKKHKIRRVPTYIELSLLDCITVKVINIKYIKSIAYFSFKNV